MPLAEAVQSQGQCSQRKPSSQTHSPRGPRSHARTVESGQTDLHTPPALLTPPGPSRPPARRPSRQRGPRRPGSRRRRASLSSAAPSTAWLCSSCLAMAENAGCTLSAGALLFRPSCEWERRREARRSGVLCDCAFVRVRTVSRSTTTSTMSL